MSSVLTPVNQIYKRTEVIGRGKFGIVYKGHHRTTKQTVAIKVLNLDTSEDEVKDAQLEVQFLSSLKTVPNITHYYGAYLNDTKLWIIMDYCAGGSLRTLLRPGRLEEKYIGVIVRELLFALQAIHKQGVIHRDIKAANVLITNEGKVQLCDFGVAAQLTSQSIRRNTMAGTPYWMAPEVIMEGTSYDSKCDIWSLGVTIYEIATGNPPYCEMEALRAMQMITKSKPARLEGREYSTLLKEIVALCLDENAEERLSAEDLLKSKFVKFHRSSPTILLKEVISRYLVWREKRGQRESMSQLMRLEEEEEEAAAGNDEDMEIKWDFDSLSSNEYIVENNINVENIHLDDNGNSNIDELNFEVGPDEGEYDDGDDQFVTGYHPRYNHMGTFNKNNNTNTATNRNGNTYTYNNNAASTLKYQSTLNRKDTPKSLLQLFEDRTEEEEEEEEEEQEKGKNSINNQSNFELPHIPSSIGLHNLNCTPTNTMSHSSTAASSRVKTPVVEIEIPSMDEIQSSIVSPPVPSTLEQRRGNRSRSGTMATSSNLPISALEKSTPSSTSTRKTLDSNVHVIQRRPTLSNNNTTSTSNPNSTQSLSVITQAPHSHSQPILPTMGQHLSNSAISVTSAPPLPLPTIQRTTPSPNVMTSSQTTSPTRMINSQPLLNSNGTAVGGNSSLSTSPTKSFVMMKAISSPTNKSPLLQPLNTTNITSTGPAVNSNDQNSVGNVLKSRKNPNLRLQMPTPTSIGFPKLLNEGTSTTSTSTTTLVSATNGYSSQQPQDENINQFGVNVSNIPMTMTPLTEKPPVLLKRKPTLSAPPAPVQSSSQPSTTTHTLSVPHVSVSQSSLPLLSSVNRTGSIISGHPQASSGPASEPVTNTSTATNTTTTTTKTTTTAFSNQPQKPIISTKLYNVPQMDLSLFMDSEYQKDNILSEIQGLLVGLGGMLGSMEELLVSVNE